MFRYIMWLQGAQVLSEAVSWNQTIKADTHPQRTPTYCSREQTLELSKNETHNEIVEVMVNNVGEAKST